MKKIEVKVLHAGQKKKYGDSYYEYKVTSNYSENIVRDFCTKVLRPSVPKSEMETPFDSELVAFYEVSSEISDEGHYRTYIYKTQNLYTG